MRNNRNNPCKGQGKDKGFRADLQRVYDAFYTGRKTMKEVTKETGILREFVCWYCKALRESDRLWFTKKRQCSITGVNEVLEFTPNPDLVDRPEQLKLFQNEI